MVYLYERIKLIEMRTLWKGNYLGNEIVVLNTWFRGERVYVNNKLQGLSYGWFGQSKLKFELPNQSGKVTVRVKLIAGFLKVKCYVFADGNEVSMKEA